MMVNGKNIVILLYSLTIKAYNPKNYMLLKNK